MFSSCVQRNIKERCHFPILPFFCHKPWRDTCTYNFIFCFFVCVFREEEGRKEIKSLQKQISTVRIEREEETQQRNQMIAHLKGI